MINLSIVEVQNEADANYVERIVAPGSFSGTAFHSLPTTLGEGGYDIMQFYADPALNVVGANNSRMFIHEIGHGLGLVHTHDGAWPGVSDSQDSGDFDLNSGTYSIMSYVPFYDTLPNSPSSNFGYFGGPLAFDIAAVQALYGPNMATGAGDDIYDIPTANQVGTFYWSVWDAGGIDLVRNSSGLDSIIDLRAATLLNAPGGGGWYSRAPGISGGFTIANGVVIENAQGGSGKDSIQGNDAANQIDGGAGDDMLAGGAGADTLTGGEGQDRFVYAAASESVEPAPDLITDFNPAEDELDVEMLAISSATATAEGGVTKLTLTTADGPAQINLTGTFSLDQLLPTLRPVTEGTPAVDDIDGTVGGESIFGFEAGDAISGMAGSDLLVGGLGNDLLEGGEGDDRLIGGLALNPTAVDDGDDSLVGGDGNDRLAGGFGDDVLDGGAGTDWLDGQYGDDRFLYSGSNAGALTTVVGGGGIDTLVIGGLGAGNLYFPGGRPARAANVTVSGQTIISYTGLERVEVAGGDGNDTIIAPFTPYGSLISGGGGNDLLEGADGNDRLDGGPGDDDLWGTIGNDRLIGGAGADWMFGAEDPDVIGYLAHTDSTEAARDTIEGFVSGVDKIDARALGAVTIGWTSETDQQTGDAYSLVSIATASGAMSIRVNGAVAAGDFMRQGEPLIGSAQDDSYDGLAGADEFFMQQGGDDGIDAKGGSDGIYFGGAMTRADSVDGGAGIDTLALQGNYGFLALGAGVVNIDVLFTAPGNDTQFGDNAGNFYNYAIASVDANVAASGTLTLFGGDLRPGEDLIFDGAAESDGHFRIFAGQGLDRHTGGDGSDGFYFGADGNLTGADRVDGGTGIDSLAMRGNYVGATAVVFEGASFTGIEVLTFLSGHTNEFGGFIDTNGFDYDVTLADGNVATATRLEIIATTLRANESVRVDARAELDGSVRILAGASDDTLFGSAGSDVLFGGLGADALDGSGGPDTYQYRNVAESQAASRDTLEFDAADKIDLMVIDADSTSASTNEAFAFIGDAAFGSVAGQLRAFQSGGQWIVEGDVDGNGIADFVIAVNTAVPLGPEIFTL